MVWLPGVTALFVAEVYHCVVHVIVLLGWRQLPRRDLVRSRIYFLVDAITVALITYWLVPRLWPLGVVQNIQHLAYFFCWERSWFAKRVISWSSLDWDRSRWQPDLIIGTLFDIAVHVINTVCLSGWLSSQAMVAAAAVALVLIYVVMYNPRLAWTSKDSMPAWVERRLRPISREQAGEDHRLIAAMGWAK